VAVPDDPSLPSGEVQKKLDNLTVLAVGDTTDETTVIVSAQVSDPDPGDQLRLLVELRPVGVAFTGTATDTSGSVANGATAAVGIPGLSDDTDYHWQIRALDQTGRTGAWKSFGGNPESAADFHVAEPDPPSVQALSLGQFKLDGVTPIDTGSTTDENRVTLKATVEDPDPGDQILLEVEVKPFGTPFSGSPTLQSLPVTSGQVTEVVWTGLANDSYHWRVRARDQAGDTSGWLEFGTSGVDFAVNVP
jgi:hypothetical protein